MLDQSVLPSFRCLHVVIYDLTDEVMSKLTAGSKDCMKPLLIVFFLRGKPLLIVRDTTTAKISRGASKLISGVHYIITRNNIYTMQLIHVQSASHGMKGGNKQYM
jgi:hypothetical protein